ncbi:UDP-N-acetylglucosamine 2-epimerase [Methanococcoides methylutens]|uniref:UDP-N-acetylglucosamine 2-epimerase n=1 Tax=Methanococcoides methylutens TaxID=2226 RepID=A0A099SYX3_METMT|nr:UDP-N-acetylglucosamine 2-epimerase (non-hydrolyzing) [Methanococcoides methylutens]KGK98082.1 UDP-N-acetylglucosamine 2-epimerase [Methanococcoides methylutens]
MTNLKVMTILGTRPEIIRLSEVIKKLDKYVDHILVHTNQNYDYELNQIFFEELNLRNPDYVLNVKSSSIGGQIGNILSQTEEVVLKEKPDAILILGDTNSALSCIVAKRLKIPIFHMEAGNRCFDDRVPEEINRRIVDHTADINLPYTEHARRNLLREGLSPDSIYVSGSPMAEVLETNMEKIENSSILDKLALEKEKYFLVSIHREENVDNTDNLKNIFNALESIADKYDYPIIISTHPRTRKRIDDLKIKIHDQFILHKPFGMFDFVKLQKKSFCVLSDSGTIHEDAGIMGIPSLVVRESSERPEAYDTGNVILTGTDPKTILMSVDIVRRQSEENIKFSNPYDYQELNVSDKVVRLIVGMSKIVPKKKYYLPLE